MHSPGDASHLLALNWFMAKGKSRITLKRVLFFKSLKEVVLDKASNWRKYPNNILFGKKKKRIIIYVKTYLNLNHIVYSWRT